MIATREEELEEINAALRSVVDDLTLKLDIAISERDEAREGFKAAIVECTKAQAMLVELMDAIEKGKVKK